MDQAAAIGWRRKPEDRQTRFLQEREHSIQAERRKAGARLWRKTGHVSGGQTVDGGFRWLWSGFFFLSPCARI